MSSNNNDVELTAAEKAFDRALQRITARLLSCSVFQEIPTEQIRREHVIRAYKPLFIEELRSQGFTILHSSEK